MDELKSIYEKHKIELESFIGNKNTIKGQVEWAAYRANVFESFVDEVNKKCAELDNGSNKSDLLNEVKRLKNLLITGEV